MGNLSTVPSHWLFQCANACLLASYVSISLLFLRSTLCIASIFYTLFNALVTYTVDGIIWNSAFAIINFVQILLILKERLPIKFTEEEEALYNAKFSHVFSRLQFRMFMDAGRRRVSRKKGTTLMIEGNPYANLSIVVKRDPKATLLITRNKFPINTVKEYQWVGLPEITALLRQADSNSMIHSATPMCNNVTCILNTDDTEIVYYKWEIEDLAALFKDKNHGMALLNGLRAQLLCDVASLLEHMDKYAVVLNQAVEKVKTENKLLRAQSPFSPATASVSASASLSHSPAPSSSVVNQQQSNSLMSERIEQAAAALPRSSSSVTVDLVPSVSSSGAGTTGGTVTAAAARVPAPSPLSLLHDEAATEQYSIDALYASYASNVYPPPLLPSSSPSSSSSVSSASLTSTSHVDIPLVAASSSSSSTVAAAASQCEVHIASSSSSSSSSSTPAALTSSTIQLLNNSSSSSNLSRRDSTDSQLLLHLNGQLPAQINECDPFLVPVSSSPSASLETAPVTPPPPPAATASVSSSSSSSSTVAADKYLFSAASTAASTSLPSGSSSSVSAALAAMHITSKVAPAPCSSAAASSSSSSSSSAAADAAARRLSLPT